MLSADILSTMEVQHANHNHQQSEKQSKLPIETADLSLDQDSESNRNDYSSLSKLRDEQDESCSHFGLDLDLPHPDNYRPETVDFPSSPSAMMKYRDDDEEEERNRMSLSNQPHNNGSVTDSEDEQSFCAVIDSNNSVRLKKGGLPDRIPQKAMKRISIVDDMMTRACDDDSDTEYDLSAVGQHSSTDCHAEEVEVDQVPVIKEESNQQPQPQTPLSNVQLETPKSESLPTPSDGWDITPDRTSVENSIAERMPKPDLIPETSEQQEDDKEHNWRSVIISGLERKIDLKAIEPYKKVLSHGGYQGDDCQTAIIVFSACFLPDRSRVDYDYVMDHLFLYVLTTLDQLVAEDYVLVYFHGATPKSCIPRFSWVKNCYQMIDRRLRKNLKRLYLVHPTLWLKAAVLMCRPFISAKFSRKIVYVPNLPSLTAQVPMDQACIPDRVKQLEFTLMIQDIKRRKGMR